MPPSDRCCWIGLRLFADGTAAPSAEPAPLRNHALNPSSVSRKSAEARDDGGLPAEAQVELRLALSVGLENAIGRYSSVSPSEASNRVLRMTCAMPAEYRGFFRDFIRFSQCWTERVDDERHIVCFYNPWSDGAMLFPIRRNGTRFSVLATPVVLAGETLRDERLATEPPQSLVPPDGDVAREVFERTNRIRSGFRLLSHGFEWSDPESFDSKDEAYRKKQLKAVFSRILALTGEQSAAIVLEASGDAAAIRYGDFLGTLMDGADCASFLNTSDAAEWNRLPDSFRRSLWPVRIVPYEDELLVVFQSPLFTGTAVFLDFPNRPGDGAASLSFLDFSPEN